MNTLLKKGKKSILFISLFPLLEPLDGGRRCILNRVKAFSKKYIVDLLIIEIDTSNSQNDVFKYRAIFPNVREILIFSKREFEFFKNRFIKKIAIYCNWFFDQIPRDARRISCDSYRRNITRYVIKNKIDIVVFEFPQSTEVLDMKELRYHGVRTVVVAHGVESIFLRIMRKNLPKFILDMECKRMENYENKILNQVDKVLSISPEDTKILRQRYGLTNISYVPPYMAMNKSRWSNSESSRYIIFSGSLSFFPNYDGIKWFLENIFHKYIKIYRDINIKITGKIDADLESEFIKYKNLIFTGYLSDKELENEMINCLFAIVPILKGSGIKIKLLEALSYGIPVVATLHGYQGVPFNENEPYLLGKNEKEYLEKMILLTENKELRKKISGNAITFFNNIYASNENFDTWIREVVK